MTAQRSIPVPDENAPLNGMMIFVWVFAWVALILDVMDWQMVSVSAKLILKEFEFPKSMMGFILGAPLLGAGIGGLVSGVLSDKFGRVNVMFYCLIWYSLFTVAFAFANSFESMLTLRILVGLGLGAQWGVGNTLVAEVIPSRFRIMGSAVIQTGFAFGPMLAGYFAKMILPTHGWRPMFYIGAVGFIMAVVAKIVIPEPEAWLAAKKKAKEAKASLGSIKMLFSTEIYEQTGTTLRRNTIGAFFLVLGTLVAYWGAFSWIPNWLQAERGMDIIKSMNYYMFLQIGGIIGYIVFAFIADRFGRKKPSLVVLAASFVCVLVFVSIRNPSAMLFFAPIYSFITYPIFGLYGGYMAELFPTSVRATGVNGIYNLARMAAFFGPSILGWIAAHSSFTYAIGTSAFLYLFSIVPLLFLPETKKRLAVVKTAAARAEAA